MEREFGLYRNANVLFAFQSYLSAETQKWDHMMNDWKQEKVKLMNALIGPSQSWIDIRKGPEQTILNETTFGGRSSLNSQEMAYAREVHEYNKLVCEGAMRPSLIQRFAQVAESFNDSVSASPSSCFYTPRQ